MDGILIINKPKGFTSHDVVAKLRGILKTKKIGHTGTLDPDATGVLPVCVGKATRLCEMLADHDKCYRAKMVLGIRTDTEDLSGKILSEISAEEVRSQITEEAFREVVESFVGKQMQIPPMYSAIKKDGKKLYEYARAGIEIERTAREITVYSIEIEHLNLPEAELVVSCSKGTYIRSLCRDIGEKLAVGGCLSELTRTGVDRFFIENALTLEEVERIRKEGLDFSVGFLPLDDIFRGYLVAVTTPSEGDKRLHNGNKLLCEHYTLETQESTCDQVSADSVLISVKDSSGTFLGLYRKEKDTGELTPYKMFL